MSVAITADDFSYEIEAQGLDMAQLESDYKEVHFPTMIFMAAATKDALDPISLGFLGFITVPILSLVIFFWMLGKGSFLQKKMRKWFVQRFVVAALIEIIPGLNFAPTMTVLVLMAHYRETKIMKELDHIIETGYQMRNAGLREIIQVAYANR